MGAWGTGIFENDFACDWALEIDEDGARNIDQLIATAFTDVTETMEEEGYVEVDLADRAFAALLTLVEIGEGKDPEVLRYAINSEGQPKISSLHIAPERIQELLPAGISAAKILLSDPEKSEALELWADADDEGGEWRKGCEEVIARAEALFT